MICFVLIFAQWLLLLPFSMAETQQQVILDPLQTSSPSNNANISYNPDSITISNNEWHINPTAALQTQYDLKLSLDKTWSFKPNTLSILTVTINTITPTLPTNIYNSLLLLFNINNHQYFSTALHLHTPPNNHSLNRLPITNAITKSISNTHPHSNRLTNMNGIQPLTLRITHDPSLNRMTYSSQNTTINTNISSFVLNKPMVVYILRNNTNTNMIIPSISITHNVSTITTSNTSSHPRTQQHRASNRRLLQSMNSSVNATIYFSSTQSISTSLPSMTSHNTTNTEVIDEYPLLSVLHEQPMLYGITLLSAICVGCICIICIIRNINKNRKQIQAEYEAKHPRRRSTSRSNQGHGHILMNNYNIEMQSRIQSTTPRTSILSPVSPSQPNKWSIVRVATVNINGVGSPSPTPDLATPTGFSEQLSNGAAGNELIMDDVINAIETDHDDVFGEDEEKQLMEIRVDTKKEDDIKSDTKNGDNQYDELIEFVDNNDNDHVITPKEYNNLKVEFGGMASYETDEDSYHNRMRSPPLNFMNKDSNRSDASELDIGARLSGKLSVKSKSSKD